MSAFGGKYDDEYSVIGDKGEIGFIDYEDDKSVLNYDPDEEGPVIISVPFPFVDGKPRSVSVGEIAADTITVKNTTDEPVDLWTKIYASTPENSFTLSLMKPPTSPNESKDFLEYFDLEDRMVQPGEVLTIWLLCKPKEIGLHTSVVHLDVGERIERVVFLLAEDKVSQSLASRKPYSRGARKNHFSVDRFVSGKRPARLTEQTFKNRLPRYEIPEDIRQLIQSKQIPDVIKEGLTRENYKQFFKTLLIMEELQLEEDMKARHMENVTMRRRGQFLSLEVPGLAEKRPSLVHGDFIFAKFACEDQGENSYPYQGFIHRVEADEVYLKFDPEFHMHHRDGNLYNVQFSYNRVNMRRLYQAIDGAQKMEREFLFPSESQGTRQIEYKPLVPISLKLNEEQMCAIEMIVACEGAPPYVIYGPPGTGKTNTLVEAILQLYKTQERARILVCAPSNSAADHVLDKILNEEGIEVRGNEIFRLNAASRSYEDVKPEHICFSFFDEQVFKCPPLHALNQYKIVVSTYMSSCLLYAEGVKRGHFSHIFLDEAGQASEPESMIPISNLCKRETVVVLAGDPKQLGPVIFSKDAEANGLGKSYLERLFECEPYHNCNEHYITRLVRNYRSHPEILHLPSKLFYDNELFSCKDDPGSLLASVDILPRREFPILFLGVQGLDEREGNNPSWFNRIEISKVLGVIKKLMGSGSITEEDIGIIAPYRQQVLKLKKALEDWDMPNIKVGSVEQFQGQEKEVIIISTVRSTVKHKDFDRKHCLGFLSNSRRFNVAITRSISLLIIIGNPHIISKDRYWNQLLWRCADNNSYEGCALPEREEIINEYESQGNYMNHGGTAQPFEQHEWSQEPFQPEWSQEPFQPEWSQEPFQPEFPSNKDEDQWSDGWR